MKEHQKMIKEQTLPDVEERWEQSEAASKRLEELGYIRIGFDHFARPDDSLASALKGGSLHRNFQGYTADKASTLIGFGASAIGSLPQGYVQNFLPTKQYTDLVEAGALPIAKGIVTGSEDILRREIIERLMCDMEVDIDTVCAHHQVEADHFSEELNRLSPYVDDDICRIDGGKIFVSENARPFVRLIAAAFDRYLNTKEGRHSSAV
jgi:oxygen-independent coproporphyrinogen-3 oxidase